MPRKVINRLRQYVRCLGPKSLVKEHWLWSPVKGERT